MELYFKVRDEDSKMIGRFDFPSREAFRRA